MDLVLIIYDTPYCGNECSLVCFGKLMKFYCQILTPLFLIIYRLSCARPPRFKKEYHVSQRGKEEQTLAVQKIGQICDIGQSGSKKGFALMFYESKKYIYFDSGEVLLEELIKKSSSRGHKSI